MYCYVWFCIALEHCRCLKWLCIALCCSDAVYWLCVLIFLALSSILPIYWTGSLLGFEVALYSSVLQQCSILALCGPIFLAEHCTAMYGCILHWSLAGLEVALYSSGLQLCSMLALCMLMVLISVLPMYGSVLLCSFLVV